MVAPNHDRGVARFALVPRPPAPLASVPHGRRCGAPAGSCRAGRTGELGFPPGRLRRRWGPPRGASRRHRRGLAGRQVIEPSSSRAGLSGPACRAAASTVRERHRGQRPPQGRSCLPPNVARLSRQKWTWCRRGIPLRAQNGMHRAIYGIRAPLCPLSVKRQGHMAGNLNDPRGTEPQGAGATPRCRHTLHY